MTIDSNAAGARMVRSRQTWDVPLRIVAAMAGGYALTSLVTMLLARILPGGPLDAAVAATLMSFAIYTAAIVWVFAARNALAVTGWVVGLTLLAGTAVWLSLRGGAPV